MTRLPLVVALALAATTLGTVGCFVFAGIDDVGNPDGAPDAGASADPTPCPAAPGAVLAEDGFYDGVPPAGYEIQALGVALHEAEGTLIVDFPEHATGQAAYVSTDSVPEDVRATIEIVRAPAVSSNKKVALTIGTPPGITPAFMFSMGLGAGELYAVRVAPSVADAQTTAPFDASAHRWWRIRREAHHGYFEVSPDGATWTPFFDADEGTEPVLPLHIGFGGSVTSNVTEDTAGLDCFREEAVP